MGMQGVICIILLAITVYLVIDRDNVERSINKQLDKWNEEVK